MAISIYTYKNPYEIRKEKFWPIISNCPYFCSSQTLVNGLSRIDEELFKKSRITTYNALLKNMYSDWMTPYTMVKQYTEIDNIIRNDLCNTEDLIRSNLYKSFVFNVDDVQKSIRTLFELNVKYKDISLDKLNEEQKYIVDIYHRILGKPNTKHNFNLIDVSSGNDIDAIIRTTLIRDNEEYENEVDKLDFSTIVIHGIHQFSPLGLRAIEVLSAYKNIILLFNYQDQYKEIYQTWANVYENFESDIVFSTRNEYYPSDTKAVSYKSNMLADSIGSLCEGKRPKMINFKGLSVVQFDNMTEFANYVANIYDAALDGKMKDTSPNKEKRSVLSYMTEKFYSADGTVNDILKIYYPEQFGERQFLNYPLGHFFLAIANMWNPEANAMEITEMTDIKECLYSSILQEKHKGELLTIFEKAESLFEGCTDVSSMIKRLKRIKKNKSSANDDENHIINKISYYTLSEEEISVLINGLSDLDDISKLFFNDFEENANNFKIFYEKIKDYLSNIMIDADNLQEEFKDILVRVLERINTIQNINATASFNCLKSTMYIYLQQEEKYGNSANWIVKNFEQIDGDILQSINGKNDIYHFACLSDEDINAYDRRDFSWPLDQEFFEVAQNPIDWKYQVFVTSSLEYRNFKRYALVYGLEFNRSRIKLSYVKKGNRGDKSLYYLLKMLGINEKDNYFSKNEPDSINPIIVNDKSALGNFNHLDLYKYKLCEYRFLLDSVVENNTVYKDNFLQIKYFETLLERLCREQLVGLPATQIVVREVVETNYYNYSKYFPFATNANKADVIKNVIDRLLFKKKGTFSPLSSLEEDKYETKENFIISSTSNKDVFEFMSDQKANELLQESIKNKSNYAYKISEACKYCSNKDICLAFYKSKGDNF